jgi:hypothetical protein
VACAAAIQTNCRVQAAPKPATQWLCPVASLAMTLAQEHQGVCRLFGLKPARCRFGNATTPKACAGAKLACCHGPQQRQQGCDQAYLCLARLYVFRASSRADQLQALGRCIRHRYDYGAIMLLDERFQEPRNQRYLSRWVRGAVKVRACCARTGRPQRLSIGTGGA